MARLSSNEDKDELADWSFSGSSRSITVNTKMGQTIVLLIAKDADKLRVRVVGLLAIMVDGVDVN